MEANTVACEHGYRPIISHRSGETCDDYIADLAVGTVETHTDPAHRHRVAQAGGSCPSHLRLQMETSDGRNLLPALFH